MQYVTLVTTKQLQIYKINLTTYQHYNSYNYLICGYYGHEPDTLKELKKASLFDAFIYDSWCFNI